MNTKLSTDASRTGFLHGKRCRPSRGGLILLLTAVLAGGAMVETRGQVTVKVDATKDWQGYMNVNDLSGAWVQGSAWALEDLRGSFDPNKLDATAVVLAANTNTYDTADTYWNLPDGTSQKLLEANFYVDVGTDFAGESVTFEGEVEANTLPAGWTCEAVVKEFASGYAYVGDTRVPLVGGQPFTVTRPIGANNICQYGFITYGPNTAPGSPEAAASARIMVDNSDPSITGKPSGLRRLEGDSAEFTVVAVGQSALSYQWSVVQGGVTNLLSDGANVSGSSTETLTLSAVQASDSGTYVVTVTNLAGSRTATAELDVKTPAEYVNFLDNPGFEADPTGQDDSPWQRFSVTDPNVGRPLSASDTYFLGGNVNVYDGTYVSFTTFNSEWSGIYQDVAAEPGQVFTGSAWLYNASGDPIPGGPGSGSTNECFVEIQFRNGENVIQQYVSDTFDYSLTRDVWMNMQVTNAGTFGSSPPESDAMYLVAPPDTTKVRFQLTLHDLGNSVNLGSVFYDNFSLLVKIPVELDIAQNGGNTEVTWQSLPSTSYQVQYKDDMANEDWSNLEVVAGDGSTITRSYPASTTQRTYRVLTL